MLHVDSKILISNCLYKIHLIQINSFIVGKSFHKDKKWSSFYIEIISTWPKLSFFVPECQKNLTQPQRT